MTTMTHEQNLAIWQRIREDMESIRECRTHITKTKAQTLGMKVAINHIKNGGKASYRMSGRNEFSRTFNESMIGIENAIETAIMNARTKLAGGLDAI